jgi:hypothetical protein
MEAALAAHLSTLSPAQRVGLTLWVYGTILAGSACQVAVVAALLPLAAEHALRQRLREWLYAGVAKAVPGRAQVAVAPCFVGLVRWVVSWWRGTELALAIDATALGDQVVVLAVTVLYRGSAIPVAWAVLPANRAGAWIDPILGLLDRLAPAVPSGWTVLVLTDRGLWSNRLWDGIRAHGWHPLMRVQRSATFAPLGHPRRRADTLIPGPGHAWLGAGTAFKDRAVRRQGTLIVTWEERAEEPWLVLTDLSPEEVGACWYGLRSWTELGFRALKGVGWQWQRTRRSDPDRVARHWLVLAVATIWAMAVGTRAEDAALRGVAPAKLRAPVPSPAPTHRRTMSVLCRGLGWLRWQVLRVRRLWSRLWLAPEPWPEPPPGLTVTVAPSVVMPLHSGYLPL